jgi:hypothetical protein
MRMQSSSLAVRREVRHAAARVVRHGSAEILLAHLLVRHGLDHVGTRDEHVGAALHHEDEVGDRRRVDGPAGARPHDRRDLRHHARRQHVAQEDVRVARQRYHALLDARAARIVEPDHGRAGLRGVVHDLADLLGERARQRAAEHREVLREHEHQPAVDAPRAGDDAVAGDLLLGHAEVGRAVRLEAVVLAERARVEQQLDALARGELALLVLLVDARLPAAELGAGDPLFQELDLLLDRQG